MNVNKICVQCKQIVYPLEQLKCLDQVWHRRCFRCQTCNMALTMGNYRGYDKKPYCSAHYPQPKRFTVVSDTPEFQRVAQNTRLFSSVNYNQRHATGGYLERRPIAAAPGKFRSVSTIELPPQSPAPGSGQQQQRRTPNQLCHMGHSMPANGTARYENGNSRPSLYSSCSASPGHLGTSSEPYDSPADANSPVHQANNHNMASWGRQQPVVEEQTTNTISNLKFRAMYDYDAKEDDEVSFRDGDIILHGDPITDGWMYGTVMRTGQFGMLPSNYVKLIE